MATKRSIRLVLCVVLWLCCQTLAGAGALSAAVQCNPDVNADGKADLLDLVRVSSRYGAQVSPGAPEDTNGDGKVDLFDLTCVAVQYQALNLGAPVVKIAPWCSQFDAPGDDRYNLNGEYACFEHRGGGPVDMSGWHVKDQQDHTYTFPAFILPVGAHVSVHSGLGTNTRTDLYWNSASAVWDNDDDTVFLYNAQWVPVDAYTYVLTR